MKLWQQRQADKGYLTWQEYMEAIEEDRCHEAPCKEVSDDPAGAD